MFAIFKQAVEAHVYMNLKFPHEKHVNNTENTFIWNSLQKTILGLVLNGHGLKKACWDLRQENQKVKCL
jgi:hypothetical protein